MINRSVASKLINCNFQSLRSLESTNVITPSKKTGYSYNQLIFSRSLLLMREALEVNKVSVLLNAFQSRPQYEIIFSDVYLMIVVDNGFFCVLNQDVIQFSDELDKQLIPLDQECFNLTPSNLGDNTFNQNIEAIKNMIINPSNCQINPKFILLLPVYRIRNYIDKKAIELGLESKLNRAKEIDLFEKQGKILVG
jgi:hypothetical protein